MRNAGRRGRDDRRALRDEWWCALPQIMDERRAPTPTLAERRAPRPQRQRLAKRIARRIAETCPATLRAASTDDRNERSRSRTLLVHVYHRARTFTRILVYTRIRNLVHYINMKVLVYIRMFDLEKVGRRLGNAATLETPKTRYSCLERPIWTTCAGTRTIQWLPTLWVKREYRQANERN